jgi:hypothetical protein
MVLKYYKYEWRRELSDENGRASLVDKGQQA